jgi:uncharacterized protein YndB with AHSA1/START domain
MEHKPFITERLLKAPVAQVWKAITDKNEMKNWYFDLAEFIPEVGFEFQFMGGPPDGQQYLHLCKITEVVVQQKLTYSWRYDGYEGNSFVTFELFPEGRQTRLVLTHSGLESFPASNPDLAAKNFAEGWTSIIQKSLPGYLGKNYQRSVELPVSAEAIFEGLTKGIQQWWTRAFEGSSNTLSDIFSIRFDNTRKTFQVQELIPNQKLVWRCTKAHIDAAMLTNKAEWEGTSIVWEITPAANGTTLTLLHEGLTPGFECFDICEKGWDYFLFESLLPFLTEGKGRPHG